MMSTLVSTALLTGSIRMVSVSDGVVRPAMPWRANTIMFDWGTIFARLISQGLANYRIGGMYLEYENVASAGDPVTAPTFARGGGVSYYNGLSGSANRDYLRAPITSATIDSTDDADFPGGNRVTFFSQSAGTSGVHGKSFDDANNSKIFGGALVAFVDEDDATQDLVMARFYLDQADQQVKLATSQLGLEWRVTAA